MASPKGRRPGRKKSKKIDSVGVIHIKSSFNNTMITATNLNGEVVAWASAGTVGFKGSRKSTPFAAQLAAGDNPELVVGGMPDPDEIRELVKAQGSGETPAA